MGLYQEVKQELDNLKPDKQVADLVLAALRGEDDVERALAGESVEASDTPVDTEEQVAPVYLQDITVSGFRGIGEKAQLKIPSGPGLTVVVGRNGSGKSSFAEGLEVLLTGESYRWEGKTVVWKDGWRNLHEGDNPKISARFQVEGKNRATVMERSWTKSSKLEEGQFSVQHPGEDISDLDGIGWTQPLNLYRPILSYKELGIIENSPSTLHDTLSKVLGIGIIPQAMKILANARLVRERRAKEVDQERRDKILPRFEQLEDPRAARVVESLKQKVWILDSLVNLQSKSTTHHRDLQPFINLEVPNQEQVIEVAEDLGRAYTELSRLSGTDAEHAEHLMRILNLALEHYNTHENDLCPVCGVGVLDSSWHTSVQEQIERLEENSRNYRKAKDELERIVKIAESLVEPRRLPTSTTIPTESLVSVWEKWSSLPDNEGDISKHLLSLHPSVKDEADKIIAEAQQLYSDKEEKWLVALAILSPWIPKACQVRSESTEINNIEKAEKSLKAINENIRDARWSPIEEQALEIWKELRLQSNVDLLSVQLTGGRIKRGVTLGVEVDNIKADAFSVVSQGEINSLALSIFFPRVMLPASPFRFLVVDDPIQSMDPARVDGLARVFAKIAKSHQLIVFTHDNRLSESLRLLDIKHLCLEVRRSEKSKVTVSKRLDPVIQYFSEARSILNDDDIQEEIARRVIPGFCRSGLEAACVEAVWRKWLRRGKSHDFIERELSKAKRLSQKVSLLFFNNIGQGSNAVGKISKKWGKRFTAAFRDANKGTHNQYSGDLVSLISDCQGLAKRLRRYD